MSKVKTKLSDAQLNEVYLWVDSFELSRPKKNIARDFADGVLMAEILHILFPKLVDMHNYFQSHNLDGKLVNWRMLQKRVFVKLGLALKEDLIKSVCNCIPTAIEYLLWETKKAAETFK
jgi:hypothetical protein